MNAASVAVVQDLRASRYGGGPRYQAAVVLAGEPTQRMTSFTCPHLHHTARAAVRCVAAVAEQWREFHYEEEHEVDDEPGLIECCRDLTIRRYRRSRPGTVYATAKLEAP